MMIIIHLMGMVRFLVSVQTFVGCSSSCTIENGFICSPVTTAPTQCSPVCGDKLIVKGEQCDDGNKISGDGCNSTCQIEVGFVCTGEPSVCSTVCGDGHLRKLENCDDGNLIDGDGCDSVCLVIVLIFWIAL